jgi:hypothetical protein
MPAFDKIFTDIEAFDDKVEYLEVRRPMQDCTSS